MVGKNWQLSVIKKNLRNHWLMLLRRCSSAVAMSWQHRRTTLSQYRKLTSPQLSFSTLPQRFDNDNYDVLAVSAGKPLRNKHFWGKYTENTTRVVWLKQVCWSFWNAHTLVSIWSLEVNGRFSLKKAAIHHFRGKN